MIPILRVLSALQNDRCYWMHSIGSMAGQPYEAAYGHQIILNTRPQRSPVRKPTIILRPRNLMNSASSLNRFPMNLTGHWARSGVGSVNRMEVLQFQPKRLASIHRQLTYTWIATMHLF